MSFKHKWIFTVFLLVLYPVTTYSQVSFKKLPIGGTSYGFEFSPQTNVTAIGARVDYGINNDSKISFSGGIGFPGDNYLKSYGRDVSLTKKDISESFVRYLESNDGDIRRSPRVRVNILHIIPFGQSELEYFVQGGFGVTLNSVVNNATNETLARSTAYILSGGGGIFKRLKTQSGLVIIPFFALSYKNVWITEENVLYDYTDSDGSFGGIIGLEIDLSPSVSAIGAYAFPFQSSDTVFSIGLNFH